MVEKQLASSAGGWYAADGYDSGKIAFYAVAADGVELKDIEAEMGPDYTRRQNRDGTAPEPAKFALAVPVYNFETEGVQIMQLTQKSIIRELDGISQMEDYANLLEHDFVLGKEGNGLNTEYSLRPVPRKKGSDKAIGGAWTEAKNGGFEIGRLLTGDNPFKAD